MDLLHTILNKSWKTKLAFLFLASFIEFSVYAAEDSSETFNSSPEDTLWRSSNPGAGGAFGTVGAGPTGIIIVGSDLGGAYRSLDRGKTWNQIGSFHGLTDTHICGLGFDPSDEAVFYIGAEHGLFRTQDTGTSFTQVISTGYITDIVIAPSNTSVGYVAFNSKYNSTDGQVYKSTNNGLTWAKASVNLPSGLHISKLLIHPHNPDILYLLSGKTDYANGSQLAFRSDDGGVHWTPVGSFPDGVKDIALDRSNPTTIYLSTYPPGGYDFGYLYRSSDSGNSWSELVHRTGFIFLDPENPAFIRLIELDYQYPNGSRSGVWASGDSGVSWSRFSDIGDTWDRGWSKNFHYGSSFNGDVRTFGEDMSDPNVIFWITSQWVFGSFDNGLSFQNLYTNEISPKNWQSRGINNAVLFEIEISPANPDIIYLGYFDLGFFRSMDHGKSWENCNSPVYTVDWKGDGGSTYTIAADPTRENVVWAVQAQDRGSIKKLLRSSQNGSIESWELIGNGLPTTSSLFGLTINPQSPESARSLFITANRNVYMSVDDGYNWNLALDCGGKCHVTAIDRFNSKLVYAGGSGGVWRSANGGALGSWEQVGSAVMIGSVTGDLWTYGWIGVMDIKTDPHNPDWLYVAAFGPGRGLYLSKNRGETWEKLLSDSYLRGVSISPVNPKILYAASSKPINAGGYSEDSNGVLKSTDGGLNWTRVNEGLSFPFASTVEIDPVNPGWVYIASPGEGFSARYFKTNGPVRTDMKPKGSLTFGTTSATLSLKTDETATCRYSVSPDTEYGDMTGSFTTTDGTNHSAQVSDLSDENFYTYYCRCSDEEGNTNSDDYLVSFKIGVDATGSADFNAHSNMFISAKTLLSGAVNFSVTLPVQDEFMLKVFEMSGRQVWSYSQRNALAGIHNIVWDDSDSGDEFHKEIYCVVLISGKNKKTNSLLFLK